MISRSIVNGHEHSALKTEFFHSDGQVSKVTVRETVRFAEIRLLGHVRLDDTSRVISMWEQVFRRVQFETVRIYHASSLKFGNRTTFQADSWNPRNVDGLDQTVIR